MSDADGILVVEVPPLLAGVRIDRAVAMLANVSRAVAAGLITSGRVLVDDIPVTVGRKLTEGRCHPHHCVTRSRRRRGAG